MITINKNYTEPEVDIFIDHNPKTDQWVIVIRTPDKEETVMVRNAKVNGVEINPFLEAEAVLNDWKVRNGYL